MVRVCRFVAAMAGAASVVQALPAPEQAAGNKPAETSKTDYKAQLASLTTFLQRYAKDPPAARGSNINNNAAMLGAAIGAVLGGTVGAYMPLNTTFTTNSILQGITTELAQVMAMREDAGLSYLTSMIPILGTILAEQPNLGRGPKEQQGPYTPPPFPKSTPVPPAAADVSKGGVGGQPADMSTGPLPGGAAEPKSGDGDSKPKGEEMADIAPPPVPGPPKPTPSRDSEPTNPGTAGTGASQDSSSGDFPGLDDDAAPAAASAAAAPAAVPAAAPVVAPSMAWVNGRGGHKDGGRRRRR